MVQKADGMNYAPEAKEVKKVVGENEFCFAAVGLNHGHIYAMSNGLREAGATLKYVYDSDEKLVKAFVEKYPEVKVATSLDEILNDSSIQLVASAAIPCDREPLGIKCLKAGKHFYADKPGMTSFEQLEEAIATVKETGKKFYVYFGERIHVESAVFAQQLIDEGKLGKVLSVTILAPHRLNPPSRPEWFWDCRKNGEILNDIGSHQFEQFLSYTGAKKATVACSRMANYATKDHPEFFDFGDVSLTADNGAVGYCRLDWFTPDGMGAWGDGRVFIVGTKASVEIRKYIDVATSSVGDHVIFVDDKGENKYDVNGKVGFPFFGEFILDCINNTENSMTQEHVFESMRLALDSVKKATIL